MVRYAELVRNHAKIECLTVHSYEMNVYLVSVALPGEDEAYVTGVDDRPMRFVGCQQVREAFSGCDVSVARLLHESAYDEMIGNPPAAARPMELPFSMASAL